MKLVREILPKAIAFLKGKQVKDAKRSAEELLAHLLKCKRLDVYMQFDTPLKEKELAEYRDFLRRAAQHEPYEQITGFVTFGGVEIHVTKDVLIPRPETELLLPLLQKRLQTPSRILDMCTGSGCLALALKKAYPNAHVDAVDISEKALQVAQKNGDQAGLDVNFIHSDMFTSVEHSTYDLIVSNPPYITEEDYQTLHASVKDHEPALALIGGDDGLRFYRTIKENLSFLKTGGVLALEIGYNQGTQLLDIFGEGEIEKDWSGHDRFFFIQKTHNES